MTIKSKLSYRGPRRAVLAAGGLALLAFAVISAPSQALGQLVITEAMTSEGPMATNDWWEITNLGVGSVNITGFKFDDNSHNFALSVALFGVTSIGPHESVVFVEQTTSDPVTELANFRAFWGGLSGIQVGQYDGRGAGVSLAAGSDEVNLYTSLGVLVNGVSFGAGTTGVSFGYNPNTNTFGGLNVAGQYGAFNAPTVSPNQNVGSPGAVPEPSSVVLAGMGLLGMGLFTSCRRLRKLAQ